MCVYKTYMYVELAREKERENWMCARVTNVPFVKLTVAIFKENKLFLYPRRRRVPHTVTLLTPHRGA